MFSHWWVLSPLPATQWLVLQTIAHDSRVAPPGSGSRAYLMAALTRHVTTRSLVWDCGFWDSFGALPPSPPPPPYGRYCPRLAAISQGKIPWTIRASNSDRVVSGKLPSYSVLDSSRCSLPIFTTGCHLLSHKTETFMSNMSASKISPFA